MRKLALAALLPLAVVGCGAQAACLNASSSVTVPLSGSALVVMYDQACNVLLGTNFTMAFGGSGAPVNGTSSPALNGDSAGLHLSANGAAPGSAGSFSIKYTPNGQLTTMTYVVGSPVTTISAGTTTP